MLAGLSNRGLVKRAATLDVVLSVDDAGTVVGDFPDGIHTELTAGAALAADRL